jgi:hypothetical protein
MINSALNIILNQNNIVTIEKIAGKDYNSVNY